MGLNQTDFAALAGQSKKSQARYEAGVRMPDATYLRAISEAGADVLYILTGRREVGGEPQTFQQMLGGYEAAALRADQARMVQEHIFENDYALVQLHDVQASAGPGELALDGPELRSIAFPTAWMRSEGLTSSTAALIFISGDSMAPTLLDKSIVMINLTRRTPTQRRIYAFRLDGELFVKRLDLSDDGMMVISSDNPTIPPRVVTEQSCLDFDIIGEVVWTGREL